MNAGSVWSASLMRGSVHVCGDRRFAELSNSRGRAWLPRPHLLTLYPIDAYANWLTGLLSVKFIAAGLFYTVGERLARLATQDNRSLSTTADEK